jgi:autotransporter-associated beta strand protein
MATRSTRLRLEVLEDRLAPAVRVCIWDGNSLSNNWSNAFNWNLDIAPKPGDELVFPGGSFNDNKVADNNFPAGFSIRSITFQGSGFTVKGNRIALGTGGITDTSGSSNRIKNDITLTSSSPFAIGQGSTLFMDGKIGGSANFTVTKTGAGNLSFEAQNDYLGPTVVSEGQLFGKKATSLGGSTAGTTINSGATLLIINPVVSTTIGAMQVPEPIIVNGMARLFVDGRTDLNGRLTFDHLSTFDAKGRINVTKPSTFSAPGVFQNGEFDSVVVLVNDKLKFSDDISLLGGTTRFERKLGTDFTIANVEFTGVISGAGGLRLGIGSGALVDEAVTFSGSHSNTYQGITLGGGHVILNKTNGAVAIPGDLQMGGVFTLRGPQQISSGANVDVSGLFFSDGLDLNGFDNTISSLTIRSNGQVKSSSIIRSGVLTVTNQIVGTFLDPEEPGVFLDTPRNPVPGIKCNLNLGNTNHSIVVDNSFFGFGRTLEISGKITGTGSLAGITKSGAGTLALRGNNTYLGSTLVTEGDLRIFGNQPGSKIFVNGGGRLLGTGTVGNLDVLAGGRVKPGSIGGFGILHVAGDLTFLAGSIFEVSLNNPIAGSGFDQIVVQGPGSSGQGSGIVHFNGTIVQPFVGLGNAIGDTFRIIDNDDSDVPANDTFASTTQPSVPQGGVLVAPGGERFTVNYRGSIGNNDVVLTRTSAGALFPNRSITPVINEGGRVTLSGTVNDPDRDDTFILNINWGDGSAMETRVFPPSFRGRQVNINHRYLNSQADPYTINLAWHDQTGLGDSATMTTQVNNVAPFLGRLSPSFLLQNWLLSRLISFSDPGADQWTMTVDYGDGTGPYSVNVLQKTRSALLQHQYSQSGQYLVQVTVRDNDGGETAAHFMVFVHPVQQASALTDTLFAWVGRLKNNNLSE